MAVNGVAGTMDIMPQASLQTERDYTSRVERTGDEAEIRNNRQEEQQPRDEARGTRVDVRA